MNRRLFLGAFTVWVLSAAMLAQTSTPREFTDAQAEGTIRSVQVLPVSKLDRSLPAIGLANWLQTTAGPDTRLAWGFLYDTAGETPEGNEAPDVVEAHAFMKDGREIIVLVAVGHFSKPVPAVYRIDVITGKNMATGKPESAELNRLRDVPRFLGAWYDNTSNENTNE